MALSEQERKKALVEARRRVQELETPEERLCKMTWFDINKLSAMQTCIDLGVFRKLAAKNSEPVSIDDLAKQVGAEPRLLRRIIRVLAVDGQVDEKGPDQFAANSFTRMMAEDDWEGLYINNFSFLPTMTHLPEYLKKRHYADPIDKGDTAFKSAFNTDLHFFEYIHLPEHAEQHLRPFELHMSAKNRANRRWVETTSAADILGDTPTPADGVLWVDVGGNVGGDIKAVREHVARTAPAHKGRYVLQDLESTITVAKTPANALPADVEPMVYDFFTPQPVQGARVYYMHMILHDWPDSACRDILKSQVPAMKKGYSKLIINDVVIKDQGAGWVETGIDMLMLGVHAATERTEAEWKALVESVGLKLVKVWDCDGEPEKLIEVELA